ncbi:MAG: preprotein translocase subunit SecE [Pseudomonadota bacterium]|nr:preprotein translocase subunit SecE [Pseudomonadota bacterium]
MAFSGMDRVIDKMQNYLRWFVGLFFIGLAVFLNSYFVQEPLLYRVIGVILLVSLGLLVLVTTEEGKDAFKITLDSRTEIRRVVWPTRNETLQTTLIVLVAIFISGLVLWGLDSLFGWVTASFLR